MMIAKNFIYTPRLDSISLFTDLLDYGNYKKALQESEKVLRKHPDSNNAKVTAVNILVHYYVLVSYNVVYAGRPWHHRFYVLYNGSLFLSIMTSHTSYLVLLKVLKALALLRLGKAADGAPLVKDVHQCKPSDESTLQVLNIIYKETNQCKRNIDKSIVI